MFCKSDRKDDEASRKSREIDRWLEGEHRHKEKDILLLGTGESGKTTILKQMRIIHINGFDDKDKRNLIPFIRSNLQESIHDIVRNMSKLTPPVLFEAKDEESYRKAVEYVLDVGLNTVNEGEQFQLPEEYYDKALFLWNSSKVKEAFRRSNEYQLIDSAKHFLSQIETIRKESYVPNLEDILYCRRKTVEISKIAFDMPITPKSKQTVRLAVTDVGGQRGERKKWIQVFTDVDMILFLIAASDFDQKLREDDETNRLAEAFALFENICWNRFVWGSGLIVFLNKQDLLRRKIEEGRKLGRYFPEYEDFRTHGSSEYDRAREFMKDRLVQISKTRPKEMKMAIMPGLVKEVQMKNREVYIHFTTAVDTNNIRLVFEDVLDTIRKKLLADTGIY